MTHPFPQWQLQETHRWNHAVEAYTGPNGAVRVRLIDDSGIGVWVDPARPVEVHLTGIDIPVHDPQLASATTPSCAHTAAYVLKRLGMALRRKPRWGAAYVIPADELLKDESRLWPRLTDSEAEDAPSDIRRWRALDRSTQVAADLAVSLPCPETSSGRTRL